MSDPPPVRTFVVRRPPGQRRGNGSAQALVCGALVAMAGWSGCTCGGEPIGALVVELRTAPDRLDLGALPVGATVSGIVTLVNSGNGAYAPEVDPEVSGEGFTLVTPCGLPLAPNGFCEMAVAFTPRREGPFTGALVIIGPDDIPIEVPLFGQGDPAEIVVTPEALAYGDVDVGTSARQRFTVENHGSAALDVPLILTGEAFFIGGATVSELHLEPAQTAAVDVDFAPSRGGPFSGRVRVEVCGDGCGPTLALAGEGLAPRLDVQPRGADFGEVAVGSSTEIDLSLANVGAGDLVVLRLDLLADTADVTLDAPLLPLTIAEGSSTSVTLRYAPTTARAALASTLRVRSNDPVSPDVLVPIDGITGGPALVLIPGAARFGVLDEGDVRTLDVVVRSSGTVAVDIASITLLGQSFSFTGPAPPLGPLGPGDSVLFTIAASANAAAVAAGGATGMLVASAGALDDAQMALGFFSGTVGCQPRAVVPNVALGSVVLGQGTSGTVTIQNVGDVSCSLEEADEVAGFPFDPGFSFSATQANSIPPGGVGVVEFGFAALDVGQRSAFVQLTYAEQPLPLLVSATARGVTGTLVGEPPVLEIGPLVEGCAGQSRVATFVNRGSENVTVTGLRIEPPDGPFSLDGPTVPFTLPGGAAAIVTVSSLPAGPGLYEAEIQAVTEDSVEATVRLRMTIEAAGELVTETFEAADISAVDVLFVVDNSGSMADDQQLLVDNVDAFIDTAFAEDENIDFHLGVTTTDALGGTGGPLVATPLSEASSDLGARFAEQALVGVTGNGIELGLESMRRAVDDFANTVNAGFLRDRAALSVIIISDEEDSGGDVSVAVFDPTAVRPVETYIEVLDALKGGGLDNAPVLVSVVVTPGIGLRYQAVAEAFSGLVLDITSPTWGEELSAIGAASFGLQRLFRLGGAPEASSVSVTINGEPMDGFSVDSASQSVTLDTAPPPDALVTITYVPECR